MLEKYKSGDLRLTGGQLPAIGPVCHQVIFIQSAKEDEKIWIRACHACVRTGFRSGEVLKACS